MYKVLPIITAAPKMVFTFKDSPKIIKPKKTEKISSTYLKGARDEASVAEKALKRQTWIKFAPAPNTKSQNNSRRFGVCQTSNAGINPAMVVPKAK